MTALLQDPVNLLPDWRHRRDLYWRALDRHCQRGSPEATRRELLRPYNHADDEVRRLEQAAASGEVEVMF
jgi:hypothetical protein